MPITVTPVDGCFVAEISGIDLRKPLAAGVADAIRAAQARYGVLIFPQQKLNDAELVAFGSRFGPLQNMIIGNPDSFIIKISNLGDGGEILPPDHRLRALGDASRLWHTDGSYLGVRASLSMLLARIIPTMGGETEFSDMRSAYDALPPDTKAKIADLVGRHSVIYSRSLTGFTAWTEEERSRFPPPVPRPLVGQSMYDAARATLS